MTRYIIKLNYDNTVEDTTANFELIHGNQYLVTNVFCLYG
jgi:hypothetical protein